MARQQLDDRATTPLTPTSANSVLTFAQSLRTPSPTDDEAEAIWEAARTAPPLFPELTLGHLDSRDLREFEEIADDVEVPTNFHLGLGERAVIGDTCDAAGNRQSVLLVYDADDYIADDSPVPRDLPKTLQPSPVLGSRYEDKASQPTYLSGPDLPSTPVHRPQNVNKGKNKGQIKSARIKRAFKIPEFAKAWFLKSSSDNAGNQRQADQRPARLPPVRPVQLPTSESSTAQPAQPVPRKTVGHPDRMTRWDDFSQYRSEGEPQTDAGQLPAPASFARRRHPNLNKPLPRIPSPNSRLRLSQCFEPTSSELGQPQRQPSQRKSTHRRTAVYAGSIISTADTSEHIDDDSSCTSTPTVTQTPPTSEDEDDAGSVKRHQLLDRLNRLNVSDGSKEISMHLNSPYRSPHLSKSVNDEIGRLNNELDRPFDPDDESPVVDTFVHEGHTSVFITERLDERTIRSQHLVQQHRDGETVEPTGNDPTKAVWDHLSRQVGGGWSED